MKRITREHVVAGADRLVPRQAALTVELGEVFCMETETCGQPVIYTPDDCLLDRFVERRETGPVYINGVKAGDAVRLDILNIEVTGHASGARRDGYMDFYEIKGSAAIGPGGLSVPVEPMIGVICFTPEKPEDVLHDLADVGGNLDYRDICAPNSICLTARRDGGLLYAGDLHAHQGWGEWLGVGLECAGIVTLRAGIENTYISQRPVVIKKNAFSCIASRKTYGEAVLTALGDAAAILQRMTGASYEESLTYCRLTGNGMNGQMWHIQYPRGLSGDKPETDMPYTVGIEIPTAKLCKLRT